MQPNSGVRRLLPALFALGCLPLASCATSRGAGVTTEPSASTSRYTALLGAGDRSAADRARDAGRHPLELLEFLQARPGMRVADIGAADGYTTELLARAVGPTGTVYAQNSKTLLVFAGAAWPRRLATPPMRCVVRVDRELDDPLPPEAKDLALVVMNAIYHDTLWLGTDRARMNKAIFDALAPGGAFVVIDSSAGPIPNQTAPYELHRVDEQLVRREVQAAGFRMADEGTFLRNPSDTRDWNAAPNEAGERLGTSDRFALKFVKP